MVNWILGQSFLNVCLAFMGYLHMCSSKETGRFSTYSISSFAYAQTFLKPYEWRYLRVELPPWFSSMSLALESDVDLDILPDRHIFNDDMCFNQDISEIKNATGSSLPMLCFREGSPPLPDVHNMSLTGLVIDYISNDSFVGNESLQNSEKCYPMQKNIWLIVTNEQISSGIWYFGLFNGIGPVRTQSKMINRGTGYSFRGNITVEGCAASMMVGHFCNQTINSLSCEENYNTTSNSLYGGIAKNVISCRNPNGVVCHEVDKLKVYSLDLVGFTEELVITASNVTESSGLMCYVRLNTMPLKTAFDFSGDISKSPLVISRPKAGSWYIIIQSIDISNKSEEMQTNSLNSCYLLDLQVFQCPENKAGLNCTFDRYVLQTVLRKNPLIPFESYYVPLNQKVSPDSTNFPLEPLLSNFSNGENTNNFWTFFLLDIPSAAAGGSIHVHLASDAKISYEIYARYGGLPSLKDWDYFYANSTNNSNGSMFFKLYDSDDDKISFYMLFVRGGTWSFGLKRLSSSSDSASQTTISLSLERCPRKCSSHGTCQSVLDTSGLALYSYCACDRDHGGFDCSIELVSHQGHIRQSIFLIASNAAAMLPAYWSLRNKAFAEWILFMSSGISSALYHACDVGTWCVLSFRVLQFLDFWLSFMAVVSTFVYLSTISEVSKRTIHTVVAILTALMAETGPTRSSNIALVIAIGALGLLVGLLIEFCTRYQSLFSSTEFNINLLHGWETVKSWIHSIIKTMIKRFRWGFILAGFTALAMAGISWKMESTESYWIWHSLWHISIYTSSFLFLCSKVSVVNRENERSSGGSYELTWQDSSTGLEQRRES